LPRALQASFRRRGPPRNVSNPSLWRQSSLQHEPRPALLSFSLPFRGGARRLSIRWARHRPTTMIEGDYRPVNVWTRCTSIEGAAEPRRARLKNTAGKTPRLAARGHSPPPTDHGGGRARLPMTATLEGRQESQSSRPISSFRARGFGKISAGAGDCCGGATIQFGPLLGKRVREGQVDCGDSKSMAAGAVARCCPTDLIMERATKRTIDGIEFEFQRRPEQRSAGGMHFSSCATGFDLAENCTQISQSAAVPRRDVAMRWAWSKDLERSLADGAARPERCAASTMAVWGKELIDKMSPAAAISIIRADQDNRLMNHGLTASRKSRR